MPANLDQIIAATRQRLSKKRRAADVRAWERQAAEHVPRGFRRRLDAVAATGVAVIAELKKASPSKGLIRADFHAGRLAHELEEGGAAALSVLTEPELEKLASSSSTSYARHTTKKSCSAQSMPDAI